MNICTGCGLCCQHIFKVPELKEFDLGNGTCRHYNHNLKSCNIYETRPDICRVDVMYESRYYKSFSKDEYIKSNAKICNSLQDYYNMDESFRVVIDK